MLKSYFYLLLLLTCTAYPQDQEYDFARAEQEARRLVYKSPDSALAIIKTTLKQKGTLHDTIYGNTYNLYGIYSAMMGKSDSAIYYFKKSLTYIDDYPDNRMRSLINLATGYRNKGDYAPSIKYLGEALEIAKRKKNNVGIAMVYGEMASVYNYQLEYDKSVNLLLKAVDILREEQNRDQLVSVKQKLANTYLAMENFEFAADLYKETLTEFREIGMEKNYYLTLINLGEAYIRLEQYSKAMPELKEAIKGLEQFGDKELLGITHSKIAMTERMQGNYKEALLNYGSAMDDLYSAKSNRILRIAGEYIELLNELYKYDQALEVINKTEPFREKVYTNIQDEMVYVGAIAETYSHTDQPNKAYTEFRNLIAIKDSIAGTDNLAVKEVQAKFQTALQREKNISLEANNRALQQQMENEQNLLLFYIIGSIAIIIIILALLRSYWLKSKLQNEQLRIAEAENNLISQKHQHEREITNAQKDTIEEKQRELTATTLRMADVQNRINEISAKCADGDVNIAEVRRELNVLLKQQDYWKQFETRFNSLHPDFERKLTDRFEKLTKNDIEFCSLLKLNLTNKEIASLLQISHESVITKKYRIKKKMEITDDSEFERLLLEL